MIAALEAAGMNSEAKTVAKCLARLEHINNILQKIRSGLCGDNDEVGMVTPMLRLKCDESYYLAASYAIWKRAQSSAGLRPPRGY
jgi:hypothetical protein